MKRVLLAEDEPLLRCLYEKALMEVGFDVMAVSNGREAMKLFDRVAFDVVITDVSMPQADGNIVSRHIRSSSRPHVPIVVVSADIELLQARCDVFLLKPFPLQLLVETVKCF